MKPPVKWMTRLLGAALGASWAAGPASAAPQECYDFSDLTPDVKYQLGDTINAAHSVVLIKKFHVAPDTPTGAAPQAQFAIVSNTVLAKRTAPELRMYLANAQVTPQNPVRKVRLYFAEATPNGLLANLEVNGDKRVVEGGLVNAIGTIGNGQADVAVTMTGLNPGPLAGFNTGVLEINARPGQSIDTFSIGGLQLFVDDVCMVE